MVNSTSVVVEFSFLLDSKPKFEFSLVFVLACGDVSSWNVCFDNLETLALCRFISYFNKSLSTK